MQTKKSIVKYIILVLAIAIFIGIFIFSFNDINEIVAVIKEVDLVYLMIAIVMTLVYFILTPVCIMILLYYKKEKIKPIDAFCVAGTEFFFRAVTPFNSGGEPFQIYGYKACGVKPSKSTPVILVNFAIYQFIVNIASIIALVVYFNEIYASLKDCFYIVIIGLIVNIGTMLLLIFAMSEKMGALGIRFCRWLANKKLFKKILTEERLTGIKQYFIDMSTISKEIVKNWPIMIINVVVKIISLIAYNSIPYFVFKAIGVDLGISQFVFITILTVFAMTMLIWVPTPGASGGIEFVFTIIFASLGATGAKAVSGMLIWRFLTYYLLLILGFILYLIFSKRRKLYENRDIQ